MEGLVTNSVTGDPVKKASVVLQLIRQNPTRTTVTDSAGRFHFDDVAPGNYQAIATRDGFIPPRESRHGPFGSKPFAVAEEQQVKQLVLKLIPLAVVSGHVFDEDGDPIVRAQVQALRYVYRPGDVRQLNPAGFATTNDLGEYQFLDLEPGQYYFLAAVQPRLGRLPVRTRSASPELTYPDTLYPSALHAEQATVSQLSPGAQLTGIDFRVHKVRAFHVRGRAVDGRTGKPIRNAWLRLQPRESVFFDRVRIQENGMFDARGVMSGSYILISQTPEELSVRQTVNVGDHDVDDVSLIFRPPFEISGNVQVEGAARESKGQIQVGLNALEIGRSESTLVDADGKFSLKVLPGPYQIVVSCNAVGYVKAMHFGDQDLSNGKIDLSQQSSGALNIVCGTDVGQLQGTVQTENGEPAGEALITVLPDGERLARLDLFNFSRSDATGKFELHDLAPGDYKVFAWQGSDDEMLRSTEFSKAFESRAASLSILPSGHLSVQLKLIPAADIEAEKNKLP